MSERVPKFVTDTIAALRAERLPMGARLDAIDLALENLRRVWPNAEFGEGKRASRGVARTPAREVVLAVLAKSTGGLTAKELKLRTPGITSKDRSNVLQRLKAAKEIRRAGKTWIRAAA